MEHASGERWMTYAEVAELRGCSRAAAERWTQRQNLRRQPGNDGRTLVLLAPADVEQARAKPPPATPPNVTPALAAFEQVLAAIREEHAGATLALREQLAGAGTRADEAHKRADVERARATAERRFRDVAARLSAAVSPPIAGKPAQRRLRLR